MTHFDETRATAPAAHAPRKHRHMLGMATGLAYVALGSAAVGCASTQLRPTMVSPADATGYAVRYPDALSTDATSFAAHKRQAHALSASLTTGLSELKPSDDRMLLSRVVDQADADGRRESFAQAERNDRALRTFWEEERGPISARVAAATQKQVSEAHCTLADTQPSVQQALRAAYERQLERRLRAQSEAQHILERYKSRLTANSLTAMQKLADNVALDSYLVNVALPEDVNALNHRVAESTQVDTTLQHALAEERALQARAAKGAEQKAITERIQQVNASRIALGPSLDQAQRELSDQQAQLQLARDAYVQAINAIKTELAAAPAPTKAPAPTRSTAAPAAAHAAALATPAQPAPQPTAAAAPPAAAAVPPAPATATPKAPAPAAQPTAPSH
jgi:hypothetical protein